jgi:hypothetical protein
MTIPEMVLVVYVYLYGRKSAYCTMLFHMHKVHANWNATRILPDALDITKCMYLHGYWILYVALPDYPDTTVHKYLQS